MGLGWAETPQDIKKKGRESALGADSYKVTMSVTDPGREVHIPRQAAVSHEEGSQTFLSSPYWEICGVNSGAVINVEQVRAQRNESEGREGRRNGTDSHSHAWLWLPKDTKQVVNIIHCWAWQFNCRDAEFCWFQRCILFWFCHHKKSKFRKQ